MPGRFCVVRCFGLMSCLTLCLVGLAGCDRSQAPGPGPKPISGNASQAANAGASAPPAAQH